MDKRISVIIPTYNRYEMLKQSIESVYSQVDCDIEIIVIDDNSNDDTVNIKADFPEIRYFRNEINMGPGYNRKIGLENATGNYVVFLDDDDYYTNDQFYSTAIKLLNDNNDLIFVSANAKVYKVKEDFYEFRKLNVSGSMKSIEYLKGFLVKYDNPFSTFTTVFRREILHKADFESMQMVNDMAIYMRSLIEGSVYFLDDIVGVYRVHANNISNNISRQFLISNLEEKLYVYNRIKSQKLFAEYVNWWNTQVDVTIGYWIYGSIPPMRDVKKMKRWCFNNTDDKAFIKRQFEKYEKYILDYKIYNMKAKIKKIGIKIVSIRK